MPEKPPAQPDDRSDAELIKLHKKGDPAVFEIIVRRYEQELFQFLFRFLRSRAAAEDVFQEAFLQVHNAIDKFDTSRNFRPWLFTVAANKARDYLRKQKGAKASLSANLSDDGDGRGASFIDLMQGDSPMPDESVEAAEVREQVRQIVSQLPDHLREILLLGYFHKLPYKKIAEQLGVPLGTVKSRLHAAVGTFATLWKERFGGHPDDEEEQGWQPGSQEEQP